MQYAHKPIDQQVIVVTGASSGIGLTTAEIAAQRGAKVVLAARSRRTLDGIVRNINDYGGQALAVVADVGDRRQVNDLVAAAIDRFGIIDTWVNNAGVSIYGRLTEVNEQDNRRLFETNFWGTVHGSLAALPYLTLTRGTLINIGSEVSEAVVPLQGMYVASKHAVKGFTDTLRVELEADEIPVAVTLIQPTAVDTPYPQHAKNYLSREPKLPSPMIEPQRVAEAVLDAATRLRRDIKVGLMAKVNTAVARTAPSIGDWMATKQIGRQQYDEQPRSPEGTLYTPGESGLTHGEGPRVEGRR
jgi:short-subunit dehydrogenase